MAKKSELEFNKNEDSMKLSISALKRKLAEVELGGGKKKIEKHHSKGKMTARERIDYLLDKKRPSIEIGAFAGDGMYKEYGGYKNICNNKKCKPINLDLFQEYIYSFIKKK